MKNDIAKQNIGEKAHLFIKDPLFMFFCPVKAKRADFIDRYFNYYLEKWSAAGELIETGCSGVAAVLRDPDSFVFRFPGRHGMALRMNKFSYNVLNHMEIVQDIVNIVVPQQMKKRVLTVFAAPEVDEESIQRVIDECKKRAEAEGFVLVYETFSKRFLKIFEENGFATGYSRQYLNTQFFQSVLTYNI